MTEERYKLFNYIVKVAPRIPLSKHTTLNQCWLNQHLFNVWCPLFANQRTDIIDAASQKYLVY